MSLYGNYPNPDLCSRYGCYKQRNVMSTGCEGCYISNRGQQENLTNILSEAKKWAEDNEKTVAIYKEGFETKYCEASIAIANNYPILQILSQHK